MSSNYPSLPMAVARVEPYLRLQLPQRRRRKPASSATPPRSSWTCRC